MPAAATACFSCVVFALCLGRATIKFRNMVKEYVEYVDKEKKDKEAT